MPTVTVIDGVTFTCTNAFESIPVALRPGHAPLTLTDDEKDDPSVLFTSAATPFEPDDPTPHSSWELTEHEKLDLYMKHVHLYGIRNWHRAFEHIYGVSRALIKPADYARREALYAHGLRAEHGVEGPRKWDKGYVVPFRERVNEVEYAKIRAEIDESIAKGKAADKIVEELAAKIDEKKAAKDGEKKIVLPPIASLSEMVADRRMVPAPDTWSGIVRRRHKLIIGGPSKARKTWTVIGLSLAVANGVPYWGHATLKSKVLYLNFELDEADFRQRAMDIGHALRISDYGNLDVWTLRGHAASIDVLKPKIIEAAKTQYGMVVLDPIYKCLGDRDENNAGDINGYLNEVEKIGMATGATMVIVHHFAKGSAAGKAAIDRTSGSGVFSRDPDAVLNLTPHDEDDAMTVSISARAHAPIADFCVRWNAPVFELAPDLNPADLKNPAGTSTAIKDIDVCEAIGRKELTPQGAIEVLMAEHEIGICKARDAFNRCLKNGFLEVRSRAKQRGAPKVFYGLSEAGQRLLNGPPVGPQDPTGAG